ncbi:MAG TPA: putative CRISPR-associated protein, partial [Gemmataceae bacterium]|nr:putative CRISPR-associated protein [Gemmataceae bacterium]
MTEHLLLLSTCGTSALTNGADPDTLNWLKDIANKNQLSDADAKRLNKHVAERRERLLQANPAERRRLSAELNGVAAVLDRWKPRRIQHLLVHTDTASGKAAADIVAAILEKDGGQVQPLTAPGLQTDDFPSFREALADVTEQIEIWLPGYRQKNWTTVFNLTGGFKSVNAYLQALGMLYADRCVFLFESAPMLMEIPRLPIKLAEADEIRRHLTVFRKLKCGYSVAEDEAADVPDMLLFPCNGQVTTSVWGNVVWGRVRKTLFSERLLDPLSPKLLVSEAIGRTFEELDY